MALVHAWQRAPAGQHRLGAEQEHAGDAGLSGGVDHPARAIDVDTMLAPPTGHMVGIGGRMDNGVAALHARGQVTREQVGAECPCAALFDCARRCFAARQGHHGVALGDQ